MSSYIPATQPFFGATTRWALRVLSWLAFGATAWLAWHTVMNSSIAGCSVGSHNGCDAVMNSAWSKWLGIPVAIPGLACYATLAALSVLLGIRSPASRWITTAFVLLGTLAAGASIWFIALQVFVIREFCIFCMTADIAGVLIGIIVAATAIMRWRGAARPHGVGNSAAALSALRSAIPAGSGARPATVARSVHTAADTDDPSATTTANPRPAKTAVSRTVPLVRSVASSRTAGRYAPPTLPIAYGGALALLAVLIGGQVVFPSKSFEVQQVALNESIDLSSENSAEDSSQTAEEGKTRVAMRIPADGEIGGDHTVENGGSEVASDTTKNDVPSETANDDINALLEPTTSSEETTETAGAEEPETSAASTSASSETDADPVAANRKITLLGGKLTLDIDDHPVIGSRDAKHFVVEMISYDCSHCRKTNKLVKQALSRYGNQVAVVVLILPLDSRCNRLVTDPAASHAGACTTAGTAIALSKINPALFPRLHDYIMSGSDKRPPALESILAKAYAMVNRTKLKEVRDSKETAKQIAGYVDLYDKLRQQNAQKKDFGLPIQILGDHIMSGSIEKSSDLYDAWEEHLGVKPR